MSINSTLEQTNTTLPQVNQSLNTTFDQMNETAAQLSAATAAADPNKPVIIDGVVILKPYTAYEFAGAADAKVFAVLTSKRQDNYFLLTSYKENGQEYQVNVNTPTSPKAQWVGAADQHGDGVVFQSVPEMNLLIYSDDGSVLFEQDELHLLMQVGDRMFVLPIASKAGGENALLGNLTRLPNGNWKLFNLSGKY